MPKLRVVAGKESGSSELDSEEPELKLSDVGGMEEVKRRLQLSFLGPLKNPALMSAYGKTVGGGLLLYGPPGCGKTFIARALAGELGAKFINVGLSDVLDMYMGESERRLHELLRMPVVRRLPYSSLMNWMPWDRRGVTCATVACVVW